MKARLDTISAFMDILMAHLTVIGPLFDPSKIKIRANAEKLRRYYITLFIRYLKYIPLPFLNNLQSLLHMLLGRQLRFEDFNQPAFRVKDIGNPSWKQSKQIGRHAQ